MKLYEYCWSNYKAVKFSTVKRKINNYKNKLENLFSLEKRNYKKRYRSFLLIEENV